MKIGFFDSGIGGLTVLKKVVMNFGNHNYFYFGDTLNVPYGTKPQSFLINNLEHIFDFFEDLGVDILIAACNTTDSLVNKGLVNPYDRKFKYISIIKNGLFQIQENDNVLLLATQNTINLGSYRELIIQKDVKKITEIACPLFVPLIEEGYWYGPMAESIIRYYLIDSTHKYDKVILGCTHYPILKKHISKIVKTQIIDPSFGIINSLKEEKTLDFIKGRANINFYVSGETEKFKYLSKKFLKNINYKPSYSKIDLVNKKIIKKF